MNKSNALDLVPAREVRVVTDCATCGGTKPTGDIVPRVNVRSVAVSGQGER